MLVSLLPDLGYLMSLFCDKTQGCATKRAKGGCYVITLHNSLCLFLSDISMEITRAGDWVRTYFFLVRTFNID